MRGSEELYRTLINTSPDGITLTDADGKILMASTQAMSLFGITDPTEVIGRNILEFLAPEDQPRGQASLKSLVEKATNIMEEFTGVRKDGIRFTFESNAQVLKDSLGHVARLLFINRDTSARRQTEDALQLAEARWRTLIENAPAIIATLDRQGTILSTNRTTGQAIEQKVGTPIERYAPALEVGRIRSAIDAVFQTGQTIQYEIMAPQADGSVQWFDNRIAPIRRSGQVEMAVYVSTDITERKLAEEALAQRARELAALYETSVEITSRLDLPFRLEVIVIKAAGLLGAPMGGLYLVQPDTEELELVVSYNMPGNYVGTRLKFGEGLSGRVAQTGEPMMVSDYQAWEGRSHIYDGTPFRRMLGVPLKVKKQVIGVINISDAERTGAFTAGEIQLVSLFADQAAIAVENARLYSRVERLAVIDELTEVFNRRGLFNIGQREVERALRFGRPLSALFFDIDNFKDFNNRYTHEMGDKILKTVARCCQEILRKVDVLGRYGGDEFAILLVEATRQEALEAAERVRHAVENLRVHSSQGELGVTISVGVAQLGTIHPDLETLLHRADQAMYAAKEAGGNCMVIGAE